ncbi:MAG: acetylornithine/succinylornithine family transaminase [Clostridia bacterium]|nr:acetylornithine/succinylornithine family transaminase [Clostridia bacterium]
MSIREIDQAYVAGTYKRFPVEIVSGQGSICWDAEGKEYIDLGTGIAVNTFGYADEVWQRAVTAQIGKVQHTSNLYYTEPCALLAQALCQRTGMGKVFFSNSGAEANECAIKVARKYAAEHLGPEYATIITLRNSFHGRTLTTLAATGQDHYHELFQPLTPGFVHVDAEKEEQLAAAFQENKVAGVLVECVQGEGGVVPLSLEYAQTVERIAHEQGALLMVDEVQTGNGRTGTLYAYQQYGLHPDVVSTAKGLAGGLPLGATLLSEEVQHTLGYGDHGSTFGGNPVCCAAALSVLERIDEALLAEVQGKSAYLKEALSKLPGVRQVTGLGLMLGLQTEKPAGEVVEACRQRGLLLLTAKDRVRLLPALNIPMELLEKAVQILAEAT